MKKPIFSYLTRYLNCNGIVDNGINISYVVQDKRDGLGKAVYAGKHIIGDDIFLVVLGDNFFHPKTFLKEISEFHNKKNPDATIGVAKIEDPTRHGIIKPGDNNNIIDIIEKPSKSIAPSNLGAIGIYLFNKKIIKAIDKTKKIHDNKILTSAYSNIALTYNVLCEYKKSIQFGFLALELREMYNDTPGIAKSLNNIGTTYHYMGRYNDAIKYYSKSLKLKEILGNKQDIASTINNIGLIYLL